MAFSSYYAALFTKPLIRQLIAVIQRDMQGALDLVTGVPFPGTGSLPSFVEYDLAPVPPENLPQLVVMPPQKITIDGEQTEYSHGELHCLISVANQDPNILSEMVQDYLRALSYVIDTEGSNAATSQKDMYTPLPISLPFLGITETTPIQTGSLIQMRVRSHDLGRLMTHPTQGFLQTAGLSVRIELEEI